MIDDSLGCIRKMDNFEDGICLLLASLYFLFSNFNFFLVHSNFVVNALHPGVFSKSV